MALAPPLIGSAALGLAGWAKLLGHPTGADFGAYYALARLGRNEGWDHLYDLAVQHHEFDAVGQMTFYPNMQVPPAIWLVTPFSFLPVGVAYLIWSALILGCSLLTWRLLVRGETLTRVLHLAAYYGFLATSVALYNGQVSVIIPALVAVSWALARRDRQVLAGLILSLTAIKPQLAILVPFALLVQGQRRLFLSWVAGSAVILLVTLATVHLSGALTYVDRVRAASTAPGPWLVRQDLTIAGLLGHGAAASLAGPALAALALVIVRRRRREALELAYAVGLLGSMLITPFLHAPDLAILLPMAWFYLRLRPPAWQSALLVAGFILGDLAMAPVIGGAPLVALEALFLAALWVRQPVRAQEQEGLGEGRSQAAFGQPALDRP